MLIQYFYEGLQPSERNMIDAASGGALVELTVTQAKVLISKIAANTQQFGVRHEPTKKVHEVSTSSIEYRLDNLTSLVEKLYVGNQQQVKACGVCNRQGHMSDMCPEIHDTEQVNVVGGYQGQRIYYPYAPTYNQRWRDHPNLRYGQNSLNFQPSTFQKPATPNHGFGSQGMSLEQIITALAKKY